MLDLNPWRMLDLLHRKVAGSMLAGRALCTALHSTLSVIGSSVSLLPATMFQITEIWTLLAESAGSCLSALSSIAVVLPAAVLQLVVREHHDGMPHDRGCWLPSVLEGVHDLESRVGKYPASLASVQLLTSLCAAVGLNEALVHLTVQILSGIGCYHAQWNFAPTADCWELSRAVLNLLKLALQVGCVAPLKGASEGLRSSLLHSIIQDGLLTRLFWVCLPVHARIQFPRYTLCVVSTFSALKGHVFACQQPSSDACAGQPASSSEAHASICSILSTTCTACSSSV